MFDNELRVDADDDAVTVPEVIDNVYTEIFSELDATPNGRRFTNRDPMISSLRRNLQRELIDRLIDRQRFDDVKKLSGQFTKITAGDWRLLYALALAEKRQGHDEVAQAKA